MTGGARPKARGAAWERRVRDYFRERGYDCERAYGAGRHDDPGDLILGAWIPMLIDCKVAARSERARWIDELRRKIGRLAGRAPIPFTVERRRSHPVAHAFVTFDLVGFVDLLDAFRDASSAEVAAGVITPRAGEDRTAAVRGGPRPPRTDEVPA